MATKFRDKPKAKAEELDPLLVKRVAIKATARLLSAWGVDNDVAGRLAGATSARTWLRMKNEAWPGALSQDQLMRMSALIGLYQGLHMYFGEELADSWVRLTNDGPLFRGASPVEFMLEGGIPAIIRVRDYVDALRGGL